MDDRTDRDYRRLRETIERLMQGAAQGDGAAAARIAALAALADAMMRFTPTTPVPPAAGPGPSASVACPRCNAALTVALS